MNLSIVRPLAIFCFYLSCIRATNIGLFYPSDEFDLASINYLPQTLMNYVLLLGIIGFLFVTNDYSFIRRFMSHFLPVLLAAGALLSLALSTDKIESFKFTVAVIAVSVPTVIYLSTFGTDMLVEGLGKFAVSMAYINLVYLILFPQYAIMTGNHDGRWKGMFEHKNFSGPFFAVAFFLIMHNVKIRRPVISAIQGAAMAICLAFVYFAQSSTALVTFAVMGFVYGSMMVVFRLATFKDRITVILVIVSSLILLAAIAGPYIADAFFSATGKDATLTGRTGVWGAMFELVSRRPLIGYGPGLSERPDFMEQVHHDVGWDVKSTHNSYIDLLISFGYPETVLIVLLLLSIWFRALAYPVERMGQLRTYTLAASLMVVVFTVAGANASTLVSRSIFWLFMVSGSSILLTRGWNPGDAAGGAAPSQAAAFKPASA